MMKQYNAILVLAALLFFPFVTTQAQSTFAPDRPGLGDGTYVVQPRTSYLEAGAEYYEGGAIDQFSFGQVLFRHGLARNVELRLSFNSFVLETRPQDNQTGAVDPGLGLKFDLYSDPESPLSLSGLASVSIPAGYSPFTNNRWEPSATFLADYQLSEYWSLNSNIGYSLDPGDEPDLFIITLTPGFAIAQSSYGGYFGYAGFLSAANSQHFIEGGITRLIAEDVQLDINAGIDANNGDAFAGAGLAIRF